MGVNFRRLLISELERRRNEIDSMLGFLRGFQTQGSLPSGINLTLREEDKRLEAGAPPRSGGLRPDGSPRADTALASEILNLRQQGLTLRAIAEHVQISHAAVWKLLRRIERNSANSP